MKISNSIKKIVLSATLLGTMATSFQARSVAGGLISLVAPAAGIVVATTGLGVGALGLVGVMFARSGDESVGPAIMILSGLVMLDGENGQTIQFEKLPNLKLQEMGLTNKEALAYNDNTDELASAFNMVSRNLSFEGATKEDSVSEWNNIREILGVNAVSGMTKVLQYNIDHSQK